MNPIKTVAKKIKNNPAPYLAAAAVAGGVAGFVLSHKLQTARVYTLGHMHRELAKSGFEILIVTTELADKIAPLNLAE